jgi:ubiquinone/menaquinone biosynthesis C-methylase UbiE
MRSAKEKVYDDVYGRRLVSYEPPSGVIGFLYRKLRRFEIDRYKVAYNLLPFGKETFLDVGCGDGGFVFMAKNKFKECYGVDISPMRIQEAKKRSKERSDEDNLHFDKCDVDEGLPFGDSFFDAVSCIAVLEHIFNPPNVLDEFHRVLKPNGILVLQVPNIAWIQNRIQLLFGKLPVTGGVYLGADWEHLHNFTKSTLRQLIIAKGFKIESISCSGVFAMYRRWWSSALGGDFVVKSVKT